MPDIEFFIPLLVFNLTAAVTPGPNNLIVAAIGGHHGYRRGLPFMCGVTVGWPLLLLAIGFGLGAVFQRHPEIHAVMRFVGAGFLLWLAWRIAASDSPTGGRQPRVIGFFEGTAFQFINPKSWSVGLGLISTFTVPDAPNLAQQISWIALINVPIALFSLHLWAFFGISISRLLASPRSRQIFNRSAGALLALSVGLIFV